MGCRKWQPIPVFLPGKFQGQRSLADRMTKSQTADLSNWACMHRLGVGKCFCLRWTCTAVSFPLRITFAESHKLGVHLSLGIFLISPFIFSMTHLLFSSMWYLCFLWVFTFFLASFSFISFGSNKIFDMISVFLNLRLFCDLTFDVSWKMFRVYLRKECVSCCLRWNILHVATNLV